MIPRIAKGLAHELGGDVAVKDNTKTQHNYTGKSIPVESHCIGYAELFFGYNHPPQVKSIFQNLN
jgi:hypothetical protein